MRLCISATSEHGRGLRLAARPARARPAAASTPAAIRTAQHRRDAHVAGGDPIRDAAPPSPVGEEPRVPGEVPDRV